MIATEKVLEQLSILYLETQCPRCGAAVARVVTLPASYPMSVLLEQDHEAIQCERCGGLGAREVFGRVEFQHPDDMRRFFKRAWIVKIYQGGVLATTPATLEEAWQR
ncbi:MAG: hypothetical protein A3A44_00645 [Candidatus Sungbacteria bacterium RIFCSPLOWO2_01_FULL_60_25]|uniref:Uncharacterized protein n=1 Tax=Candidatus Sungbacteria bacterium RIFCSPLOWO2_01_FULL_60_25 TaxID=1802281 RepID=A0A1G2LBP3_9BACT|nr:MAG: hypothetical protein A3A44_00645 [Candidatus Sungbacteria bacterium RIFCSPLOWO2_01_FULL_60_25]